MKFLILHGVNLNMFGRRDPAHYGIATLADINRELQNLAQNLGVDVEIFQSNHDGEMIARIHAALDENFSGVVINPGAWTHYNYALADALAILPIPIVEAHMSNIFAREPFRAHSVISSIAKGSICGFGVLSYLLALRAVVDIASQTRSGK